MYSKTIVIGFKKRRDRLSDYGNMFAFNIQTLSHLPPFMRGRLTAQRDERHLTAPIVSAPKLSNIDIWLPSPIPHFLNGMKKQSQSAWEVSLKAAAEGGWVVMTDFEGAGDHISLLLDSIRRQSAVRFTATAVVQEQEKAQREQQTADKAAVLLQSGKSPSAEDSFAPQALAKAGSGMARGGAPSAALTVAASANAQTPKMGAALLSGRRTVGRDPGKRSASGICPKNPLFKSLSGEGGAIVTRSQAVVVAALR